MKPEQLPDLLQDACDFYNLTKEEVLSGRQARRIVDARFMYVLCAIDFLTDGFNNVSDKYEQIMTVVNYPRGYVYYVKQQIEVPQVKGALWQFRRFLRATDRYYNYVPKPSMPIPLDWWYINSVS